MEHQVQQELASGSPEVPNYPGYVMFTFIRITIFFNHKTAQNYVLYI